MNEQLGAALAPALEQLVELVAWRLLELQAGPRAEQAAASPWMGVTKAAAWLDWPKQRLYKLAAAGEIPHFKQGGRLLFHRGELDSWLRGYAEGSR